MQSLLPSLIRTYVPIVVGAVVGFLAAHGANLDANSIAGLTAFLGGLFSAIYYLVARLLERKFPQLSWLLGSSQTPAYTASTVTKGK